VTLKTKDEEFLMEWDGAADGGRVEGKTCW